MKQYLEIKNVFAREIIDSRGNPTVEAEVICENGFVGRAAVPSGASTGIFEALEMRDGGSRYMGKGVEKAVENVNTTISRAIKGMNVLDQISIDKAMIEADGTENKSNLGANAILSVSLACADAAANALGLSLYKYIGGCFSHKLPVPMMNILNGGAHANNNVDIQEFMIMPTSAKTFKEGLMMCCEVYHSLRKILAESSSTTSVGDEGGFAPTLEKDEDALSLICKAIEFSGYTSGEDFYIAIDAASSEWANEDGTYTLTKSGKTMSREELVEYWSDLCSKYPIISIEDGVGEEDWEACKKDAQDIYDKWLNGERTEEYFAFLAKLYSKDGSSAEGGMYQKVQQGETVEAFDKWCFDESRQKGDTGLVKTKYGYHIMYFSGSMPGWQYFCRESVRAEKANEFWKSSLENHITSVNYGRISMPYVKLTSS